MTNATAPIITLNTQLTIITLIVYSIYIITITMATRIDIITIAITIIRLIAVVVTIIIDIIFELVLNWLNLYFLVLMLYKFFTDLIIEL